MWASFGFLTLSPLSVKLGQPYPDSLAVGFVFMLISQAFGDRHFTECEISFGTALSAAWSIRAIQGYS
jgi:hypothetical protein